jgi:hypothetical protein
VTSECAPSQPTADVDNVLEVLQHEVQRKLGRCMLRLQQYERLLKAMVATMAVEGPFEQLQAVRALQETGVSDKSLGTLVRMFTGSHLTPASPEGEKEPDDISVGGKSSAVAWASMRFNISMSPERHAQTKEALAELVELRNALVHHLIEQFDISEERGCRDASVHLDGCYEQIDGHCKLLKTWATTFVESQAVASSYLQSQAFEDMFVHGINSDGSVCWQGSSIVESFREAEAACQVDGWTSLDAAVVFIARKSPRQIPSRYGCKTWRQVLTTSGQFEFRSEAGSKDVKGRGWYRSCEKLSQLEWKPTA